MGLLFETYAGLGAHHTGEEVTTWCIEIMLQVEQLRGHNCGDHGRHSSPPDTEPWSWYEGGHKGLQRDVVDVLGGPLGGRADHQPQPDKGGPPGDKRTEIIFHLIGPFLDTFNGLSNSAPCRNI